MKIIEKVALSLLLPALMMINVYGEETPTTEITKEKSTTTKETTKEEPATQETTTTEEPTPACGIPPACPPDRSECCSKTVPQEKTSTE